MLVSIIIPTLNEEAYLPVTLRQFANRADVELLVVDGGSVDATVAIARTFTPYVFITAPNCAAQMNLGARHATGDILLFLHADTFLLPGALDEMKHRLIAKGAVGGAFDLHIDSRSRWCRWLGRLASHKARLLHRPRGDQGIFVWRQVFELLGGFPEIPILEDLAFARRLRRAGRLVFLRSGLLTSARRWHANGPLRTALVNAGVAGLFALGVPPRQLRRLYDGWLADGKPAARIAPPISPAPRE